VRRHGGIYLPNVGATKIAEATFLARIILCTKERTCSVPNLIFVDFSNATVAKVAFVGRPAFSWTLVSLPSFA
jgi:hypothetical protein